MEREKKCSCGLARRKENIEIKGSFGMCTIYGRARLCVVAQVFWTSFFYLLSAIKFEIAMAMACSTIAIKMVYISSRPWRFPSWWTYNCDLKNKHLYHARAQHITQQNLLLLKCRKINGKRKKLPRQANNYNITMRLL